MIILSSRLQKAAELIGKADILADIGCDHGYLPIYLLKNESIGFSYLCDVRDGPLMAAKKNISKYGFMNKAELIKADGLMGITDKKVDVVSVCGMGGRLISKILFDSLSFSKTLDRLVLQPMTEAYVLREFLRDNGFYIEKEVLAREDNRFYNIICAKCGEEKMKDSLSIHFGGKIISGNDPLRKPYLEKNLKILEKNYKCKKGKEDTTSIEILINGLKKEIN